MMYPLFAYFLSFAQLVEVALVPGLRTPTNAMTVDVSDAFNVITLKVVPSAPPH